MLEKSSGDLNASSLPSQEEQFDINPLVEFPVLSCVPITREYKLENVLFTAQISLQKLLVLFGVMFVYPNCICFVFCSKNSSQDEIASVSVHQQIAHDTKHTVHTRYAPLNFQMPVLRNQNF